MGIHINILFFSNPVKNFDCTVSGIAVYCYQNLYELFTLRVLKFSHCHISSFSHLELAQINTQFHQVHSKMKTSFCQHLLDLGQ